MLCIGCICVGVISARAQWTQTNGIHDEYVECLTVSGTTLFAGTRTAVFLSSDNGSSWVNTGLTKGVLSFAVSGTNLFASTGGDGVFVSTNNGSSWAQVDSGLTDTFVHSLAVLPASGGSERNLFAGTYSGGVFLSANNGATWAAVNKGMTNSPVWCLAVSGTNLFAGTYGDGVFLTTDNGLSWKEVNTGLTNTYVTSFAVSPASGGTGATLFAGTLGGMFLSINNGTSWTQVNTGLTDVSVNSIAVSDSTVYVGTSGGWVYQSTDNGTTWKQDSTGLTSTSVYCLAFSPAAGISDASLFAGTYGSGVWRRALSNAVRARYGLALSNRDIDLGYTLIGRMRDTVLTINNIGTELIQVSSMTCTNPAFTLTSKQLTIAPGSTGKDTLSFTPAFLGIVSAKVIVTSNAPSSPDTINVSGFGARYGLAPSSRSIAIGNVNLGGRKDTIITISNEGNVDVVVSLTSNNSSFVVRPALLTIRAGQSARDTIGYTAIKAGADNASIVLTTNWPILPDTIRFSGFGTTYGIPVVSKNIAVGTVRLGSKKDTLITIANGGNVDLVISSIVSSNSSFTAHPASLTIPAGQTSNDSIRFTPNKAGADSTRIVFVSNFPSSPDTLLASGFGATYGLALGSRTFSFGYTLIGKKRDTILTINNTGNVPLEVSSIQSTIPVFTISSNQLTVSPGGSARDTLSFIPTVLGPVSGKIVVTSNAPSSPDTVAVSGNGVTATTDAKAEGKVPTEYSLSQNYPNPFNPSTKISYSLPERSRVSLTVYNILGVAVYAVPKATRSPGTYEHTFDASALPSGIYICRVTAESAENPEKVYMSSKKMLMVK